MIVMPDPMAWYPVDVEYRAMPHLQSVHRAVALVNAKCRHACLVQRRDERHLHSESEKARLKRVEQKRAALTF